MDSRPPITAIILAAGLSTRFGANKLLHPLKDGVPMVRRVTETVLACGFRETLVITGHEKAAVESALAGLAVRFIENKDYRIGIASSIVAGVRAAKSKNSGYLVLLGDMPYLTVASLLAIADGAAPDRLSACRGEDGAMVPAFFGHDYRRELEALAGDQGARKVLHAHADRVRLIAVPTEELRDIDIPSEV